jgi:hypothetical protein
MDLSFVVYDDTTMAISIYFKSYCDKMHRQVYFRTDEKRYALHVCIQSMLNFAKKSRLLRGIEHGGKAIFIARKYPI